ncbi:MAG: hypothetical protein ACQGVC_03420 [Myxococcota bacterium]
MVLKPQDVFVLLKLAANPGVHLPYNRLALELGMSVSEVHAGVRRSVAAGLALEQPRPRPNLGALKEFLFHGVRYAFPAQLGGPVRGMPTAYAAPPLKGVFAPPSGMPPVWPDVEGRSRGPELPPLYRSVPEAARRDEPLYALLALTDVLRTGGARERSLAIDALEERLVEGDPESTRTS